MIYAIIILMLSVSLASALTIKGVDFADQVTVSDNRLILNGVGVRETFFSSIYVCGLYLPQTTKDATKAIKSDVCKQIIICFTNKFSQEKIVTGWQDGFFNNSQEKLYKLNQQIETFNAFFAKDLVENDRITLSYTPGEGTTVTINDKTNGTIPGKDFMQALWAIWLGDNPADGDLKEGMLGK